MIHKIAFLLVNGIIKNDSYWQKRRDLLVYSFEIGMDKIIIYGCISLFAVVTGNIINSIYLFLSMTIYRKLYPGLHFEHFYVCMIFSLGLFVSTIMVVSKLSNNLVIGVGDLFAIIVVIISVLGIRKLSYLQRLIVTITMTIWVVIRNTNYIVVQERLLLVISALMYSLLLWEKFRHCTV